MGGVGFVWESLKRSDLRKTSLQSAGPARQNVPIIGNVSHHCRSLPCRCRRDPSSGVLSMVSPAAADRFLSASWLSQMDDAGRSALLDVLREGRAPAGSVLLAEGEP